MQNNRSIPIQEAPWAHSATDVARALDVDPITGLSAAVASARLERYGPNRLHESHGVGPVTMFLRQFADLMIVLLVVAALISASIGEWADALLIGIIIVANAVIGTVQEWRAERAVEALKRMSQPKAYVWHDQRLVEIPAENIVPGDIIEVRGGDFVPADARIVNVADLQLDESALTGESLPIDKSCDLLPLETSLPDRLSMLFSGTAVTSGHGRGVVTATGMNTEIGHIAQLLEQAESVATPLQRRLAALSKRLAVAVLAISVLIFIAGIVREDPADWNRELFGQMLLVAVSLAVAAVPEGLPAVITITLALGSQHAARRHAIMRRLAAVETLGSVDVICSDKTGTLTQNRMTVSELLPTGDGDDALEQLVIAGVLCNDAEVSDTKELIGSATETAILQAAIEHGIDPKQLRGEIPRLGEIPFSSSRKRMTTLHRMADRTRRVIVKGAAEAVIDRCQFLPAADGTTVSLDNQGRSDWRRKADVLAKRGCRMLAIGYRDWDADALPEDSDSVESSLVLYGLVAIVDPVRPEASEAIARCHSAGMKTVLITGDHRGTARAIAEELGIWHEDDQVVDGSQLDLTSQEDLQRGVQHNTVYARVAPEHKLRIVLAHQARGSVVAMTGDGVNDAPALKQADIGIAMGQTGTDVSKEAADMVLADDNFATIVAAVEEGRVVYDNIRKFVRYLLTANTGEVFVLFVGILFGMPIPLLPVHILWINLVTDGLPALALAFEPAEADVMRRKPRGQNESLFAEGMTRDIVVFGVLIGGLCIGVFYAYLNGLVDVNLPQETQLQQYARTMVFTILSMSQLFLVLGIRSSTRLFNMRSVWSNYRLTIAFLIGVLLQLAVVYVPQLRAFFHTAPLSAIDLGIAVVLSTTAFVVVEVQKVWRQRRLAMSGRDS